MDKDTIIALQNNNKPLVFMEQYLQKAILLVDKKDLIALRVLVYEEDWTGYIDYNEPLQEGITYRLRPDYQEQPAIIEYIVKNGGSGGENGLVFRKGSDIDNTFISKAIDHPDFIGFKYKNGWTSAFPRMYIAGGAKTYPSVGTVRDMIEPETIEGYEVLTPTHVLFSK